jgi:NAD(P)-dependent dehydrogenase (short-subunit alcohol dehydrogenase family)
VTEEIRRAGGKALAVKADVSSEEDVASLFDTATKSLGPLGALVNNAGIVERQARVENMDAARLARVFLVNITGSFLCAREAVRRMSVKHGGRGGAVVNVWSVAARLGGHRTNMSTTRPRRRQSTQ